MSIKSEEEWEGMRRIGEIVGLVLREMKAYARPGLSTLEIDRYGGEMLQDFGARSAPQRDYDFPGFTCISINHEACHGIPSARKVLREGDLINIDVSAELGGYYGDNGSSFILGPDTQNLQPLVDASLDILHMAIDRIRPGVRIANVGGVIEKAAGQRGFSVIKNICGHGIGRRLHEAPREIPCYRDPYNRGRFRKDSVVAVETFISTGAKLVHETDDGWTLAARDRSFVAQHEHTLVVREGKAEILTAANGF